eukprot:3758297-Rhodomonas_salina.1
MQLLSNICTPTYFLFSSAFWYCNQSSRVDGAGVCVPNERQQQHSCLLREIKRAKRAIKRAAPSSDCAIHARPSTARVRTMYKSRSSIIGWMDVR